MQQPTQPSSAYGSSTVLLLLFVCAGISTTAYLIAKGTLPHWETFPPSTSPAIDIALALGAGLFFVASACMLRRANAALPLAMLAGIVELASFTSIEWAGGTSRNSWIALNIPEFPGVSFVRERIVSELQIVSVLFIIIAITISTEGFASAKGLVRHYRWSTYWWSSCLIGLLVLGAWFRMSVMPYRIPAIVHGGGGGDLEILHIEKQGLNLEEIRIVIVRDGKFSVAHTKRSLFQYRFAGHIDFGSLGPDMFERFNAIRAASATAPVTPPPKRLSASSAEGWYVLRANTLVSFTSENKLAPPTGIVDLFNEITKLPVIERYRGEIGRDICLGFCYDPMAAFGLAYMNYHCGVAHDGRTICPSQ